MTNLPSGSKRVWDGAPESEPYLKRRAEPRDWREVHLRAPRHSRSGGRSEYVGSRRSDVDHNSHRRESDYAKDKIRRDQDHSRHKQASDRSPRWEGHRRGSPPVQRDHRGSARPSNGESKADSEKEEGEISPRHSREPTPSPEVGSPNQLQAPAPVSEPQREMELDIPPSPPPVEALLAARRAKRQEIVAKYSGINQSNVSSLEPPSSAKPPQPVAAISDPTSTDAFDIVKHDEEEDAQIKVQAQNEGIHQISAADYDPNLDRREEEQRRIRDKEAADDETIEEEGEDQDVDDIFAVAMAPKKVKKTRKVVSSRPAQVLVTSTLDSAADPEGYYSVILGELLDGGRYQVFSSLGKGMFANVVRARILTGDSAEIGKEVAIKIVRCQESMYRAGLKEVQVLNKLRQADPDDKKHIVRLERTFEHRGHLCLVFESMSMNLRDVVKRFGKDVGLNIRAVRAYAHQIFLALSLLRKTNVMHADIKPDNILVNEQKTLLKLCDLGSASDASENEITPYLVSRFYRAPEIILGIPYDSTLDMWSVGCTLFELYTGKILFPGRTSNQMLLLMMELKGRFNSKMIKKAKFGDVYFDEMGAFESVDKDRITGADVIRKVHISKPTRDLRSRLMPPASVKLKDDENKLLSSFVDLLDKCLTLDPSRRITPKDALAHPFIRG